MPRTFWRKPTCLKAWKASCTCLRSTGSRSSVCRGASFVDQRASHYAKRVLTALDLAGCFEGIIAIEGMRVFGDLRPKPDVRMLRVVLAPQAAGSPLCAGGRHGRQPAQCAPTGLAHRVDATLSQRQPHGPEAGIGLYGRPPWVCVRIKN